MNALITKINYPVLEPGKELWNRVRVAVSDYFDFGMSEVDLPSYGRRHICTSLSCVQNKSRVELPHDPTSFDHKLAKF